MTHVTLARVPVHQVDMPDALARIDGFIHDGGAHYSIAINAAKVVEFQHDAELRAAIRQADLVTADGQSIVWAARLLGQPLPGRIAGVDLMDSLLEHAAGRGYAVYFLGARPEVVAACVANVSALHPTLRVAGYRHGYFAAGDEPEIIASIRAARPDILFLGFGTPAKEYFMRRHHAALGVPFVMGVGGAFDVHAGVMSRAPRWMQRAGLEWCFRLVQEPRRMWKRYLVGNSRFVMLVARELGARWLGRS